MRTSPGVPSTTGRREIASERLFFSAFGLPPALLIRPATPPSSWPSSASSRCSGSMYCWSLPSAMLCASANASCSLVVNLSNRIVLIRMIFQCPHGPNGGCRAAFKRLFLAFTTGIRPHLPGNGTAHPVQSRIFAIRFGGHSCYPAVVAAGADGRGAALQRVREAPCRAQDRRGRHLGPAHHRQA